MYVLFQLHSLNYILPPVKVFHSQMFFVSYVSIQLPIGMLWLPVGKATSYGWDFIPYCFFFKNF